MGCVSSKHIKKELEEQNLHRKEDDTKHLVCLTSSTYGVLNLDTESQQQMQESPQQMSQKCRNDAETSSPPREEPAEIINTWELMKGLEEEVPVCVQAIISPKSSLLFRGFLDIDRRSPLKFLNKMSSPRKLKRFGGKENKGRVNGVGSLENSPIMVLKESNKSKDNCMRPSPNGNRFCGSGEVILAKRSLGQVFSPKAVAPVEKDMSEEEQDIKKIISTSSTPASRMPRDQSQDSDSLFDMYDEKCPPGGQNAVVLYTTTLRGIRKTFEECNAARSIIESHHVRILERDTSLHSKFKEELRVLMGTKEVKLPLVFVRGRMIGGVDEMVRLDEEGKLDILLRGIPRETVRCRGCAGVRFMMCKECNGSSKILGEDGKKSLKCKECNENGLVLCPLCS
ncbi:hypothetical protein F511_41623 [Dorcoceras hygrometricum]|uniref:Glutaredoxin domain-containing protein n=1 Tax=Dorcoceras hygrometricum TaxID=472368 RepID=A0A2Z6ZZV6_9LAMI|nr:hypothetical protein F511_41623 [Dorcoceras hygrometricum]